MLTFRAARKEEQKEICELFTDAYMDYDFFIPLENNLDWRWKFIYEVHMLSIKTNIKRRQLFVGEDDGQIIMGFIFQDPEKKQPGFLDYLFAGAVPAIIRSGLSKMLLWNSMDEQSEKPIKLLMKNEPHIYYLQDLAVRKDSQKKGYGSRVFKDFLIPYIKNKGGSTLALITNSKKNYNFYCRRGFTCFASSQFMCRNTAIDNWCFRMEIV